MCKEKFLLFFLIGLIDGLCSSLNICGAYNFAAATAISNRNKVITSKKFQFNLLYKALDTVYFGQLIAGIKLSKKN